MYDLRSNNWRESRRPLKRWLQTRPNRTPFDIGHSERAFFPYGAGGRLARVAGSPRASYSGDSVLIPRCRRLHQDHGMEGSANASTTPSL